MDFIRLAWRELKRNRAKALVAVTAVALAAASPVLSRVIPNGYPTEFRLPERRFIGGDLLIWRAVAQVDPRGGPPLVWSAWDGSDWQSHILYFLPCLETRGYLAESGSPSWGPVDGIAEALAGVPGIAEVRPHLAAPCSIDTPGGPIQAILRGRGPEAEDTLLSMSHLVDTGDPLIEGQDPMSALVPLAGGLPEGTFSIGRELAITVRGSRHILKQTGGYRVAIGQDQDTMLPICWERPEIIVGEETFRLLAGDSAPVYQYSVRVDRMSALDATASAIRAALGPGFAVYTVPELIALKGSGAAVPVRAADLSRVFSPLSFTLSGVIAAGSIYVLLSQQRRKIGLLRAVGATRLNVVTYVLAMAACVTLAGDAVGFVAGKLLSVLPALYSDMTVAEWLGRTWADLCTVLGLSLPVAGALGLSVGLWASRIPCAEVLRRE